MILDIIVLALAFLCIYGGWRGGFAKSVITFFGFFIALFGGYLLAPQLGKYLLPVIEEHFLSEANGTLSGTIKNFDVSAEVAADVLAFGIIFICINLLIHLIKILIKVVFSFPILKQADKLMGLVFGVVTAYLFINVVSLIMFTFSEVLIRAFDNIGVEMFEGSVIARWFYENNIFYFIMTSK